MATVARPRQLAFICQLSPHFYLPKQPLRNRPIKRGGNNRLLLR